MFVGGLVGGGVGGVAKRKRWIGKRRRRRKAKNSKKKKKKEEGVRTSVYSSFLPVARAGVWSV